MNTEHIVIGVAVVLFIIGVGVFFIPHTNIPIDNNQPYVPPWEGMDTYIGYLVDVDMVATDNDYTEVQFLERNFTFIDWEAYQEMKSVVGQTVKIWYEGNIYEHVEVV